MSTRRRSFYRHSGGPSFVCAQLGCGSTSAGEDSANTTLLPGSLQRMWQMLPIKEGFPTPQLRKVYPNSRWPLACGARCVPYSTTYPMSVGHSYEGKCDRFTAMFRTGQVCVCVCVCVYVCARACALAWLCVIASICRASSTPYQQQASAYYHQQI